MAVSRRPRIVTVKHDFRASDVAQSEVASMISGSTVEDSVGAMAAPVLPDESKVLASDELNFVVASMTDKEARDLAGKTGVEAVEDDEKVVAYADPPLPDGGPAGGPPPFGDGGDMDLGAGSADMDPDAAEAIETAEQEMEELSDEEAARFAQMDANHPPVPMDDIEFDDLGHVIDPSGRVDPGLEAAGDAAGIPRDKLIAFIKCVITCAMKEFASGAATEVSEAQVESLMAQQGVPGTSAAARAIRDYITCGLRVIYANSAWRYASGSGVRVAVVDTGIAARHPDLAVYGGASFVSGTSWADDHGHGTHVAGTIAARYNNRGVIGVAPYARLYAVKVLNRNGSGSTSGVLNGLAWCYRYGMHVVNLSLGSGATTHATNNYSRAYENAGRLLRRRGILAVAAAGNSGRTSRPYVGNPARCPSFMAVSSVDCARRRSSFSSYGPQVEICAPGSNVWSTYPPNTYRQLSGTSMATPHVAGVAALVKQRRPSWHGDTIRVHLWRTARDIGSPGRDWLYGYGLVNAYAAVR